MKEKTLKVLEYFKVLELLENEADSELGKKIIRKLRPYSDKQSVIEAQEETDEAYRIIMEDSSPPFAGLRDAKSELILSGKGGILSPGGLLKIAGCLRASRRVKNFLLKKNEFENIEKIKRIAENLQFFKEIEDDIFTSIIGENEISSDASITLKNIRRDINLKNENIRNRLNSIVSSTENKKYLQESIVTIREGRYVVPVRQEYRNTLKGIVHDQSSSGATLFIEPMEIVNLNNELRELKLKEEKEIERILEELTSSVGEIHEYIIENLRILSKLDFIFAKAKLAIYMKATRPSINSEGKIFLKKARHPLIDQNRVVASDFYIGDPTNTIVITGPNTGGKTVTLKTIGLITLMAASGLQIPADYGSKVSIFDIVFADIGDEQSIEQSLSTFSSHMTNIVKMLENIKDNSLVLFDELGAGTDPTEGAALAISILDYLFDRKIKTIATTHYSELKLYALSKDKVENASVEFDIKTLSPTYRLLIGVPGKSNAFEISKRLGLNQKIIDKAKKLLKTEDIEFEEILTKLEVDRREAEKAREDSIKLRAELEKMQEELRKERKLVQDNKEDIIMKAKRDAKKIISKAKKDSEYALKEIKEVTFEIEEEKKERIEKAKKRLKNRLDRIDDGITEKILSKTNIKPLENVKIGQEVRVLSLEQEGTVLSSIDQNGNVMVQVGIMKISVPIETLEITEKKSQKSTNKYAKNLISKKTKSIKKEIDIRGMNIEEASFEIDKYLDDAYLSGLKEVNIIHGKGTGALRKGINDILKSHKHVKNQRLGKYGEGGTGVTVVSLK